jgi:hypothetical protein
MASRPAFGSIVACIYVGYTIFTRCIYLYEILHHGVLGPQLGITFNAGT